MYLQACLGVFVKSTQKVPYQDFIPGPFINTLILLSHLEFQTLIIFLVTLIELSIKNNNSKNDNVMHQRVMCLTFFCQGDVSQYFCPGSCRLQCRISVTDTRGVFLSSSPPPALIQLFWFLSLCFILCSTCEAPPISFSSSKSTQYESESQ